MLARLKRNPLSHIVSVMWQHSRGYRHLLVLYAAASVVAQLIALLEPLAIAGIIRSVETLSGTALIESVVWYAAAFVAVYLSVWLFHGPSRVCEVLVSYRLRRDFQLALFRKVTRLPTAWHTEHHSGETIDQVARATTALAEFAEVGFEVTFIIVRFVGAIVFLAWLMPAAGIAAVAFAVLIAVTIALFDRRLISLYRQFNSQLNRVAAAIQDYLTNIGTVISLRLEDRAAEAIDARARKVVPVWRASAIQNELKWFSTGMLITLLHASVLVGYVALGVYLATPLEVATAYTLSAYLVSLAESFYRFTAKYGDVLTKSARIRAIEQIEAEYARTVQPSENARLPLNWRRIEVKHLTFSHAERTTPGREQVAAIHDVSMALERGKRYALVGESGSGKSTVLKLLRGLHTPQQVQVSCDGVALSHGMAHVAHHATLIPQEPEIFAESVRFNVTLGIESSDTAIETVLEQARWRSVLERLPRGLETGLAEKGVSLSGGEKQRLALARGLFFAHQSGSDLLLLDEPTSSVDVYNERLIYEFIARNFPQHCVVSAIHKFDLLHLFDQILVFAGGRIVEHGTLDQLRAMNGEFMRLCSHLRSEEVA